MIGTAEGKREGQSLLDIAGGNKAEIVSTDTPKDGRGAKISPVMVRPVVNAVRILRYLGSSRKPLRATQIAKDLSINTSTCFNILRTLVSEAVLEFDPISKTYAVGLGIVKIAEAVMSDGGRVAAARPYLREFAERFGVTVTLWKRGQGDRITQIAVEHSGRDTRVEVATGRRGPMLMGATGRLLAARLGMSKEEVEVAFRKVRWARPLDFEEYWADAQVAAERGWAVDYGYFATGTINVAALVRDSGGNFAFSLVAILFRGQYDEAEISQLGSDLQILGGRLTEVLY